MGANFTINNFSVVVPIYNEGEKVIKLLNLFQIHIKTKFKVLLCYDLNDDNIFNYEKELHDYTFEKLSFDNDVLIYGKSLNKGAIISFNINGIHANDLAMFLDQKNIAVRTGHHCCQPLMKYLNINATARASFGIYNTKSDVDRFIEAIKETKLFFESK